MRKLHCCEFIQVELVRHTSKADNQIFVNCRELILENEPIWVQNHKAFVRYSICHNCRRRIIDWFYTKLAESGLKGAENGHDLALAYNSIEHKLKSWYPKFVVRWMIKRALK
jgi:hypothetical protein